jgi:DNA-binding MarR family transcriptional regulator
MEPADPTAPGPEADGDLVALVTVLSALTTRLGRILARPGGANRLAVLSCVRAVDGIRPSQVAEALNLHQSQITRQVQELEEEGLVTTAVAPDDRRARTLSLTAAGAAELDRLMVHGMAIWSGFVDGWDPADVRTLTALLTRLHASIDAAKSRRPGTRP